MHLLLYDIGSYIQEDLMDALQKKNITFKNILYKLTDVEKDLFFDKKVSQILNKDKYDAVMSVNYWPVLAKICKSENIKYIVWSYDSPMNIPNMYETLGYDTNYVFLFDRAECIEHQKNGFQNVYHLPLAVNTKRLDKIPINVALKKRYGADVSLVGELYNSTLKDFLEFLPEYEKGYFTAAVQTQLKIYGCNLIKELIHDGVTEKVNEIYEPVIKEKLRKEGIQITVAKEVAHIERLLLMEVLSEEFKVHLFSSWVEPELKKVHWKGSVNYFDEMPLVFKSSKINLNPTLRCIETGIPLRALDIMGSGGFLLSNYQPELAEYFIDGEEVVLYHSIEDAVMKCRYYLQHEEERKAIARKGYEKVKQLFTYEDRLDTIFHTVFGLNSNL